jgi:hypothetical protein
LSCWRTLVAQDEESAALSFIPPHLGRLMELIEARPAYRRMMTEEGNS